MTERNYTFTFLYVIGIVAIVAGHCYNGGVSLFYDWFLPNSFHVALFVFCSGYFYKLSYDEHFFVFLKKKVMSLLVPMLLWNAFYGLFTEYMYSQGFCIGERLSLETLFVAPFTDGLHYYYDMGLWFVGALFGAQVVVGFVRSLLKVFFDKIPEFVVLVAGVCVGIFAVSLDMNGWSETKWMFIVRILYFVPYYCLGIFYRQRLEKYDKIPSALYFFIVFACTLAMITYLGNMPEYNPARGDISQTGYYIPFIAAFLGIAFWLRVGKIIGPTIANSKTMKLISENTFSIMVNQFLGFMCVKGVFYFLSLHTPLFQDFDVYQLKTYLWYQYLPNGFTQWKIVYLFAGVFVPILMQWPINFVKNSAREAHRNEEFYY